MSAVVSIARKEFRSYFQSTIAYIFITLFLVLSQWIYFSGFFVMNQATLRDFFDLVPLVFLFFVPAVTMRMWAEEQKLGTAELLLTFPVRDRDVVLGKFLASFAFVSLSVLLTIPLAITVAALGDPDNGAMIGGYLGCLLLGGAYIAIGLWVSSMTQNQIVAFLVSLILCFLLYIAGSGLVLGSVPHWAVPFFANLSLGYHFDSITRGVIDSRDILYYLSIIGFFLFLNVRVIESRRWS
jgi:ABC-2 type transport system permease protein